MSLLSVERFYQPHYFRNMILILPSLINFTPFIKGTRMKYFIAENIIRVVFAVCQMALNSSVTLLMCNQLFPTSSHPIFISDETVLPSSLKYLAVFVNAMKYLYKTINKMLQRCVPICKIKPLENTRNHYLASYNVEANRWTFRRESVHIHKYIKMHVLLTLTVRKEMANT